MNKAPEKMPLKYGATSYQSERRRFAALPTARFYLSMLAGPMLWLWRLARQGQCDDLAWVRGSIWAGEIFEQIGGQIVIDGLEHVAGSKQPCVFIANHMSTLETFLLPGMLRPFGPITFVIKKSLSSLPVFGPIMRSRDPVVVERRNPRDDLRIVLNEGSKRLQDGISVVVFPQHTRSLHFDERQFNSIGVKLAQRANVPIIPIALKTDAWGMGKKIKELGPIRPLLPARFKIGQPLAVDGNGKETQRRICQFLAQNIDKWQSADGINS